MTPTWWLMVDASHIKAHQHGARGGNQAIGRTISGLNTKRHRAVDAYGMPVRRPITAETVADCTRAVGLIDGIAAEYLLGGSGV